jgi:subtilase family serine protease
MVSDKIFSFAVLMLQYQAEIILALGDLVNAATSSELRSFEVDGAAVRSAPEYFSDAHSIAIKLRHICSDDAGTVCTR